MHLLAKSFTILELVEPPVQLFGKLCSTESGILKEFVKLLSFAVYEPYNPFFDSFDRI